MTLQRSVDASEKITIIPRTELICAFCVRASEDNPLQVSTGPHPLIVGKRRLWIHGDCAVFSPRSFVTGTNENSKWFNISSELRRGEGLKCSLCEKSGATLGCSVPSCRLNYHIPCAQRQGEWQKRDEEGRSIPFYCKKHLHLDSSQGNKKKSKTSRAQNKSEHRNQLSTSAGISWPVRAPLQRKWLEETSRPNLDADGGICSADWRSLFTFHKDTSNICGRIQRIVHLHISLSIPVLLWWIAKY